MDHFFFTQVCQQCRKIYKTIRISLSNFDENGFFQMNNQEVFENFSFACESCFLLDIPDIRTICSPSVVKYIRKQGEKRQIDEITKDLSIQIEKINLMKK